MRDVQQGRNVAMGASGWDDDSGGGGRAPRRGRPGDESHDGRSSSRNADFPERAGGRGRGGGEGDPRGSSGNWDRRGSSRDGGYARDERGGSSRSGGGSGRGRAPAEYDRYERSGGGSGRAGRDPREDFDARAQGRGGSPRGIRDDARDATHGRSGGTPAGASGARNRVPARGMWDDDDRRPRRQDVGDLRGRGGPQYARGPQARGSARRAAAEAESSFTAGKGALTVLLVLLLSAGAAFAYFKVSTPHVPAGLVVQPTAPPTQAATATPSASPAASASPTQ